MRGGRPGCPSTAGLAGGFGPPAGIEKKVALLLDFVLEIDTMEHLFVIRVLPALESDSDCPYLASA